jgi:hypothetical protein
LTDGNYSDVGEIALDRELELNTTNVDTNIQTGIEGCDRFTVFIARNALHVSGHHQELETVCAAVRGPKHIAINIVNLSHLVGHIYHLYI